MELIIRFDYGQIVPWVRKRNGDIEAIAGPDALVLRTPIETRGEDLTTVAEFNVAQGDRIPFVLTWFASHDEPPRAIHPEHALKQTEKYWTSWSRGCRVEGPWREAVVRSLITLKGLTYAPTGGIVAAATTSLPEEIGGVRNWDYRYCWLRDATFTLVALVDSGYHEEACAWREWLLRAVAGSASQMQIMYGVRGERRLEELELNWLSGYENSRPVRIGNAATQQFQLDVYGEVLDSMYRAHRAGIESNETDWNLQVALVSFLESKWEEPDEGIWEVRGGRQQFTHSKMMAWVAFDRAVKLIENCKCAARENLERWRKIRDEIHGQVCARGYNVAKKAFTQFYGSEELDASLLMMPLVGFLPATDERVRNTIEAVERELMEGGFVLRYRTRENNVDGLPGSEGVFLLCSFWLADCLHLIGRTEDGRALFERLLALRNDVGLLSEQYDPRAKRQLGNFPQAFSHVALVNAARILSQGANSAACPDDAP
jgi:GH15 family glucan-1,4-alpha-glucosidase